MKTFKIQAMVRQPVDVAVRGIRDQLEQLAEHTGDPTSVVTVHRAENQDGSMRLENVWQVDVDIPTVLSSVLRVEMLAWTDVATWSPDGTSCSWQVEPHFHPDHVRCVGTTTFSSAMGGRGTRVVFSGTFEVVDTNLPGVPTMLHKPASAALESLASAAIPRGFRRVVAAIEPQTKACGMRGG